MWYLASGSGFRPRRRQFAQRNVHIDSITTGIGRLLPCIPDQFSLPGLLNVLSSVCREADTSHDG